MSFTFKDFRQRQPPIAVDMTLRQMLDAYERAILINALQRFSGSRERAAKALGISRVYLWRRMGHLKIDSELFPRGRPGRKKST